MALKTFRLQRRGLLPLVATRVAATTWAVPMLEQVTLRWFSRDRISRCVLVVNAVLVQGWCFVPRPMWSGRVLIVQVAAAVRRQRRGRRRRPGGPARAGTLGPTHPAAVRAPL